MLNDNERRLIHSGKFLDIKPKTFEVLLYLADNAGRTVSKDQILEDVWEGNFVEESNLAVHISRIRKIFETVGAEDVIFTVPGIGYRFVAKVEDCSWEEWEKATSEAGPFLEPFNADDRCESIAVLPLLNENGDAEIDYLADGITEALINNLSCRPNLRVLARNTVFRFKNQNVDVGEVGRQLNVDTVLTGRIRVLKENIALGVELCSVSDGEQIWGAQFNQSFEEIFRLQDEITNSITEKLNAEIDRISKRLPDHRHTQNTESYRLFLKGKNFANRGGLKEFNRALSLFQESAKIDAFNSGSYAELANCYLWLYFYEEISRDEAIKLTERMLDYSRSIATIPELHLAQGCIAFYLNWDFELAESELSRAISLSPNYASARYYFANLLANQKKFEDALQHLGVIMQLDPVSSYNNKNVAKVFFKMGRFENALNCLDETLDLEPYSYEALLISGAVFVELEMFDAATRNLEKAISIHRHPEALSMLGYSFAREGRSEKALKILEDLDRLSIDRYVPPTYFGLVEVGLGNTAKTLLYLEQAVDAKYPDMLSIAVDPRWNDLRGLPEFESISDRIGIA